MGERKGRKNVRYKIVREGRHGLREREVRRMEKEGEVR